jgi:hypothetical protein
LYDLATINTPTVQAPFGVSLLHPVLSIQGYDQNYMNYLQTKYKFYLIPFGNIYLFSIYDVIFIKTKVLLPPGWMVHSVSAETLTTGWMAHHVRAETMTTGWMVLHVSAETLPTEWMVHA